MRISVIITTYNAERFIEKTLHSIASQTYKDFEVIIIDDGSTDNTVKVIKNFVKSNNLNNIKLFPEKHIGRAPALNFAVRSARYDWIAIIDADDLWNIYKLEIQINYIKKFNLDFLATKCVSFKKDDEVNIYEKPVSDIREDLLSIITMDKILCRSVIPHSSVVFKKELAAYEISRNSQIDLELWLRLLQNKLKLYLLKLTLTYKRKHKNQYFESNNRFKYILNSYKLRMKYALLNYKFFPIIFLFIKLPYYLYYSFQKN